MRRGRLAGLAAGALIALPFVVTTFPPITDLPQQTAQVRLFLEALSDPASPYEIQWWTPYSMAYLALGAAWAAFGPAAAGRIGMAILGLLWLAALLWLARRRDRPVAAAVVAAVFFFHHSVYWGFYSFVIGFPAFVLWLAVTRAPDREPRRDVLFHLLGALLLYVSHALWFAAGGLWLVTWGLVDRWPWRVLARRVAAVVPVGLAGLVWFHRVSGTSFGTEPLWRSLPWDRLAPGTFVGSALGGVRGWLEPLVLLTVALGVLVVALLGRRSDDHSESRWDRQLVVAAGLLFALYLVLPDKYTNTIQFAQRWLPPALALLVLAAPWRALHARLRPALATGAALVLLGVFTLQLSTIWLGFEAQELAGLEASLEALPDEPRVLGLAFVQASPRLRQPPFLQTFAHAQVRKGGTLNFSFALFPTSLVVYREPPTQPWTGGLEWFPGRVRTEDFRYFTHVLVGGPPEIHRQFDGAPFLDSQSPPAPWRLYAVERPPPPKG